jgi:hypothetical protein
MRITLRISLVLLLLVFAAGNVRADIALFDYAFNLNGDIYSNTTVVPGLNAAAFDTATGLGTLTFTYNPGVAGSYNFSAFFDHELSESTTTFFNEVGSVSGIPGAGLTWEIDEPEYIFGDIYTNFTNNTLDNSIGTLNPEDVSMALGWNFILTADEQATLSFQLSTTAPPSGFYLQQFDPDSGENIFLSSAASITPTGVPESDSTPILLLACLTLIACLRRFRTA